MQVILFGVAIVCFLLAANFGSQMGGLSRRGIHSAEQVYTIQQAMSTPEGYAEQRRQRLIRDRVALILTGVGILAILAAWAL
ncbi:MAG: hypothetical protein ACM3XM_02925 [Mycobacterium leprae]